MLAKDPPSLKEIDSYPTMRAELASVLASFSADELSSLPRFTFVLIGPDATAEGCPLGLLSRIREEGFRIRDFRVLRVPEWQLEQLYKYHVPDAIQSHPEIEAIRCDQKSNCPNLSMIPTRNWRLLRKRYELGVSLAMMLEHEEGGAAIRFRTLKGPTDPLKCSTAQLRTITDNPCMSLIHSADDEACVARESLLFFGAARFQTALSAQKNPIPDAASLSIFFEDDREFKFPVVAVLLRLRILWRTGDFDEMEFYKMHLEVFRGICTGADALAAFSRFLIEEELILARMRGRRSAHLIAMLNRRAEFKRFDMRKLTNVCHELDVPFSEREQLLLETGLYYYRDVD